MYKDPANGKLNNLWTMSRIDGTSNNKRRSWYTVLWRTLFLLWSVMYTNGVETRDYRRTTSSFTKRSTDSAPRSVKMFRYSFSRSIELTQRPVLFLETFETFCALFRLLLFIFICVRVIAWVDTGQLEQINDPRVDQLRFKQISSCFKFMELFYCNWKSICFYI